MTQRGEIDFHGWKQVYYAIDRDDWPETLEGTNRLIRRDELPDVPRLIEEPTPGRIPALWDGRAGERAAEAIEAALA